MVVVFGFGRPFSRCTPGACPANPQYRKPRGRRMDGVNFVRFPQKLGYSFRFSNYRRNDARRQRKADHRDNPPKYGSERIVHLPDNLLLMLPTHVERVRAHGEEHWSFVGPWGDRQHQNTIAYWWRRCVTPALRTIGRSVTTLKSIHTFDRQPRTAQGRQRRTSWLHPSRFPRTLRAQRHRERPEKAL